jgi:glucokinase
MAGSPKPLPPSGTCAIGIDVGGTKIAAGLVTFPGLQISAEHRIPTPKPCDGAQLLRAVEDIAFALADQAHRRRLHIEAVGLGLCEIVDRDGNIRSGNAIPWMGLPVTEKLRRIAPVTVEADVRAGALAEARAGAARDFRIFLYVTIGTGISCCLMQDGKPYAGARGATGTLASSPLPVEVDRFSATAPPTFEDLGSGPALVARFRKSGGQADRAEDVLAAAARGDLQAISIVRQGAQALGAAIGWAVNVLDPEAVVLGGGLGLAEGLYRDALVVSIRSHIWWDGHRQLPMLPAANGTQAGFLGAAIAARHRAKFGNYADILAPDQD